MSPYEAVLRSFVYFERATAEEHAAAHSALERAVKKAPDYADAWAMLALVCAQDYGQGFQLLNDPLKEAITAARRAVEAGPTNGTGALLPKTIPEFPEFGRAGGCIESDGRSFVRASW
jgi:hypothetical protein